MPKPPLAQHARRCGIRCSRSGRTSRVPGSGGGRCITGRTTVASGSTAGAGRLRTTVESGSFIGGRMQAARARHDPLERRRVDTAGHQRDPHRHHVQQLQVAAVEAAVERAVLVPFVRVLARRSGCAAGTWRRAQHWLARQRRPGPRRARSDRPGRAGPHRGHDLVERGVPERTQTQRRAGRLQVGVRRLQPGPGRRRSSPASANRQGPPARRRPGTTGPGVGHHRGRIVQAPHGPP
jgi:hypothetical protein